MIGGGETGFAARIFNAEDAGGREGRGEPLGIRERRPGGWVVGRWSLEAALGFGGGVVREGESSITALVAVW